MAQVKNVILCERKNQTHFWTRDQADYNCVENQQHITRKQFILMNIERAELKCMEVEENEEEWDITRQHKHERGLIMSRGKGGIHKMVMNFRF